MSKFPANCRVTADMDVRLTAGAAAGVLMWTGIGQAQVPANTGETPTIVVYVEDRAGLRPGVKESAEKELVRIYGLAGVHAIWKNTVPGRETEEDAVPNITVLILDVAATKRYATRTRFDDQRLGTAVRGANRAYIFYPRVELAARIYARHLGTFLGAAVAHEVGHLLLPGDAHSNAGIMQANLDVRSLMPARFTPSQAAEIMKTLQTWQRRDAK